MWCWHRIRESESGLCPACRTPYGESPHQFTALEVEEVLSKKAKKEKQQQHNSNHQNQQNQHNRNGEVNTSSGDTSSNTTPNGVLFVSDANSNQHTTSTNSKDRSTLANMRVIRRNLVYAVGLPVAIASEEILRKPEYFGQYGKIAKIVLNRAQVVVHEDPRRASASAYVTFQHKQDTLACILALDGFYLDNRSIRASYGTSKYCSAFIKNVRCNNPECTYLHELGRPEDTFTKQEIQAGYVTSGRDVLARQQQILAEQMKEQGSMVAQPHMRTGGGGPSGTGRASGNPVFPPPKYDDPPKSSPLVPPAVGVSRASTTSALLLNAATIPGKLGRSTSVGNAPSTVRGVPAPSASTSSLMTHRKATAAAVVASGGRPAGHSNKEAADHSTLTPLTPLKRSSLKTTASVGSIPSAASKPLETDAARGGRKPHPSGVARTNSKGNVAAGVVNSRARVGVVGNSIGGEVIGGLMKGAPSEGGGLSSLGGTPLGEATTKLPGGDVYTGTIGGGKTTNSNTRTTIGSSLIGGTALPLTTGLSTVGGLPSPSANTGLWMGSDAAAAAPGRRNAASSSGVIGGHVVSAASTNTGNSSSELASILGINLPTGSGSLQESLWSAAPTAPSPLSALNGSSHQTSSGNAVGGGSLRDPQQGFHGTSMLGNTSLIGGLPIGGGTTGGNNTAKSDVALLQSLVPGVNVTGDTTQNWNSGTAIVGERLQQQQRSNNTRGSGNWNGARPPSSSFGAIGQNPQKQGSGMW